MIKKENCKDCYEHGLCPRHRTEFVTDGIHVSFWLDDMARWLMTKNDADFNRLCRELTGARFESIILRNSELPEKETKFFVDADERVWMKVGKPTWSVHNCNSQAHVKCLTEAEKTKDASGYGTIFIGDLPEPLLNITQVKELLDNLELSGFSHGEAMAIVLKVVERG